MNKILRPNQLTMEPSRVNDLNTQFPQAGFNGKVQIAPGTQKPRASTGLELQVMLPVVQRAVPPLLGLQSVDACANFCSRPSWPTAPSSRTTTTFINAVASVRPGLPVLREADDVPLYHRQDLLDGLGGRAIW